jgi:hypothetical protein
MPANRLRLDVLFAMRFPVDPCCPAARTRPTALPPSIHSSVDCWLSPGRLLFLPRDDSRCARAIVDGVRRFACVALGGPLWPGSAAAGCCRCRDRSLDGCSVDPDDPPHSALLGEPLSGRLAGSGVLRERVQRVPAVEHLSGPIGPGSGRQFLGRGIPGSGGVTGGGQRGPGCRARVVAPGGSLRISVERVQGPVLTVDQEDAQAAAGGAHLRTGGRIGRSGWRWRRPRRWRRATASRKQHGGGRQCANPSGDRTHTAPSTGHPVFLPYDPAPYWGSLFEPCVISCHGGHDSAGFAADEVGAGDGDADHHNRARSLRMESGWRGSPTVGCRIRTSGG